VCVKYRNESSGNGVEECAQAGKRYVFLMAKVTVPHI
jgi:hypothetical protein